MTFFDQLQLPPGAGSVSKTSDVTAGEAFAGLWFEVRTATDFVLFLLSVFVFVAVGFGTSFPVVAALVMALVAWQFALRKFQDTSLFRLWLSVVVWTFFLFLKVFENPKIEFYCAVFALGNVLYRFGFHPFLRLFLHVPLSSPAVQTGLALFLLAWVFYFYMDIRDEGLHGLFCVLCVCLGSSTAVLMAETALVHFRAEKSESKFVVFTPWKDVWLSIKSIAMFPLMTGLRVSALARLLKAEDADEILTSRLLDDWLGEDRGPAVWEFLLLWKPERLGKPCTEDEIIFVQPKRVVDDSPLRSPLLRGY